MSDSSSAAPPLGGPLNLPVSGQCDASGAASIVLSAFTPQTWGEYTLSLFGAGSATITLTQSGTVIAGGYSTNGVASFSVSAWSSPPPVLNVVGAPKDAILEGSIIGLESPHGPTGAAAAGGSAVGAVQGDPSALLVGAVGVPLLEGTSTPTLAQGQSATMGPFDVSGYAGIYWAGTDPGVNFPMFAILQWLDDNLNPVGQITYSYLDRDWADVLSCLGRHVQITFTNIASVPGNNASNITLIPLAIMPPDPATLFTDYGFSPPASSIPNGKWLISTGASPPSIANNSTRVYPATVMWPHHAYLTFFTQAEPVTIGLQAVTAAGVAENFWTGFAGPAGLSGAGGVTYAVSLTLPRFPVQIAVTNTSGGSITPPVHLTIGL